jgi:hypothetical protein
MFIGSMLTKSSNITMTRVEIHSQCVEQCPDKVEGKQVQVNLAQRKCLVKSSEVKQTNLGTFGLPSFAEDKSLFQNVLQLKFHYQEQIEHIKQKSLKRKTAEGESAECNNNGQLKKVFRGNSTSYYICRCQEGFLGDNCQISKELHEAAQMKLIQISEHILTQLPVLPKHDFPEILNALIEFSKFKLEDTVVAKQIEIVGFLLDRNKAVDNKLKLYKLYDSMILSIFDELEELRKKTAQQKMTDTDIQRKESSCEQKIERIVQMIEVSLENINYSHSFLAKSDENYIGLGTFAFTVVEYSLKDSIFYITNPNIDTSYQIYDPTEINFLSTVESEEDTHLNSKFNTQIVCFSSSLFEFEFPDHQMLTNPLYIKIIDPHNPHVTIQNKDALIKSTRIQFPLLFLPAFDDYDKYILCRSFETNGFGSSFIEGRFVEFDEDTQSVICQFSGIEAFRNIYFGVFVAKRQELE